LTRIRVVRIDAESEEDRARQLATEAQAALGLDITTGEWLTHFLPGEPLRRAEGSEGILALTRRAGLDRFTAWLHACGAEVVGLDLEPAALYRNIDRFGQRARDRLDATVVADVGERATRLIVGRAGSIGFYKSLQTGGMQLRETMADVLGIDSGEADALLRRYRTPGVLKDGQDVVSRAVRNARAAAVQELSREISLCMRYYAVTFKGRPPRRVVLQGGAADEPLRAALAEALAPILPTTVELRRPFEGIGSPTAAKPGDTGDDFALALGLALRDHKHRYPRPGGLTRDEQAQVDAQEVQDAAPAPDRQPQAPAERVAA
jgi:type IV pilus assembly protein PilM